MARFWVFARHRARAAGNAIQSFFDEVAASLHQRNVERDPIETRPAYRASIRPRLRPFPMYRDERQGDAPECPRAVHSCFCHAAITSRRIRVLGCKLCKAAGPSRECCPIQGRGSFERRNEIRRMLRGEELRLYDGSQNGGFHDENPANSDLANGQDFDGLQPARYLPAFERYTGRFFRALRRKAPNFWKPLPKSWSRSSLYQAYTA